MAKHKTGAPAKATTAKAAVAKQSTETPRKGETKASTPTLDETWFVEQSRGMKGEAPNLGVPQSVFLGEVVDAAKFVREYWAPSKAGTQVIPGLRSAVKRGQEQRFGLHIADELLALHDVAQRAQTQYLLAASAVKNASQKLARAHALIDQWTGVLEWHFDDGVEDDKDAQLAAVKDANADALSIDAVATALFDFAHLVDKYKSEIDGLLDFDPATIAEGLRLSEELKAINSSLERNVAADAAFAARNNALALLQGRLATVRKAAGLVFSAHPEIARRVTSAYQRRARALSRRKERERKPE